MKTKIILVLILLLAAVLRIYNLGENPPAVYGDEQAFAWNAWNILKTGQDEYGNPYPLQFRSFDDYKAPVPVYLLVPFIKIGGLNAFTIRLPVALVSILTVLVTYLLVSSFLGETIAILASLLLAISPWHIHLSRGYFEATLALLPFVTGVYFFFKARQKPIYLIISAILFVLTLYTYFTPRVLLPIFIPFLIIYTKDWIFKTKKYLFLFFLIIILLSLPLVKMALFERGLSRFEKLAGINLTKVGEIVNRERAGSFAPQALRIIMHNKPIVFIREIKNNYLEHLSLNFWYIFGDNSLRYFTGNMGMFYLFELPFFLLGLWCLLGEKRKEACLFLGWILLAPIPASLVGRSFALRSLAILPAPFVFVSFGITKFWQWARGKKLSSLAIIFLVTGFGISLGSYLLRYHFDYPAYAATWWGYENKVAIDYGLVNQDKYEKIFISEYYTGAALAFAFYTQYDPLTYRQAVAYPVVLADERRFVKLGKFYFGSLALDKSRIKLGLIPPRSLYIGDPFEADSRETLNAPDDGRTLFKIHKVD